MHSALKSMISPIFRKFTAVGLLGTLVNLLCMFILVEYFSMEYFYASMLATELSIVHNFLLNNFWTFSSRRKSDSILEMFFYYNAVSAGTLVINAMVSTSLIERGILYIPAQTVGILAAFSVNYLVNNHVLFKDKERAFVSVKKL